MVKYNRGSCSIVISCAALLAAWPGLAAAEGALAVGVAGDIAKDGYSLGIKVDGETAAKAAEIALDWCRNHGSERTRPQCKIIARFHHECAAEAYDPAPGTPGAGWAVARDKETAEKAAMSKCVATAGKSRRGFCKVASSLCDTKP
jgi:hypothetical protein